MTLTPTFNPKTMGEDEILAMERLVDGIRVNGSHILNSESLRYAMRLICSTCDLDILYDFQGFKIRVEEPAAPVSTKVGAQVELVFEQPDSGGESCLRVKHEEFLQKLEPGMRVILDDGNIVMSVEGAGPHGVLCRVVESSIKILSARKGIDAPAMELENCALPEKDLRELDELDRLKWERVTGVALSYAQRAEDIVALKQRTPTWVRVFAKPENYCGVKNLDAIARACDEVIVPRGDLFAAYGLDLPGVEESMIVAILAAGKPVTVATGLVASMKTNDRLSQSELTALRHFVNMGVTGFWINETANYDNPVAICREARKAIDAFVLQQALPAA